MLITAKVRLELYLLNLACCINIYRDGINNNYDEGDARMCKAKVHR